MVLRIFKMIATSGFLTASECTKFVFRRALRGTTLGELTVLPRPPSWLKRPQWKGKGRCRPPFGKFPDPPSVYLMCFFGSTVLHFRWVVGCWKLSRRRADITSPSCGDGFFGWLQWPCRCVCSHQVQRWPVTVVFHWPLWSARSRGRSAWNCCR